MYTSNPFIGKVRRLAVNDVIYRGLSYSQVGLRYGVTKSAVCKWMKKRTPDHREFIKTMSSRPHHHPNELSYEVIQEIIYLRMKFGRCAPVIQAHLERKGIKTSISSVARTLKRLDLVRRPKQARWGENPKRPVSDSPGALVETDTMHVIKSDYSRFYVYAVIDTFSRLGYAEYQKKINQETSIYVVERAKNYFGFDFRLVQADNGPEFKNNFGFYLKRDDGIEVRHSRVRKPNDNAHIERFIRTIQDECLGAYPKEATTQAKLMEYIKYYNEERLHLSLNLQTPREFVSKVLN